MNNEIEKAIARQDIESGLKEYEAFKKDLSKLKEELLEKDKGRLGNKNDKNLDEYKYQEGDKKIENPGEIHVSYWGGEYTDGFFVRGNGYNAWYFGLGQMPRDKEGNEYLGAADIGEWKKSPSFGMAKEPDYTFDNQLTFLSFIRAKSGNQAVKNLLSDAKILEHCLKPMDETEIPTMSWEK